MKAGAAGILGAVLEICNSSKSTRAVFAETITDMNTSHTTHFENECEKFGMSWGCVPDCFVFERGECELQEENTKMFEEEGKL